MRTTLTLALALLCMIPAPMSAKEPDPVAAQMSALLEINAVIEEQQQAVTKIRPIMRQISQTASSPQTAARAAEEIRPLIAELRQVFERSTARLAAIDAPTDAVVGDLSVRGIIADGRRQNAAVIALLDDMQGLLDSLSRRDAAETQRLAARLVRSSALLVRNQALTLEVRQAQVPKSESSHQSTGVLVNLYRAMAIAVDRSSGEGAETFSQPAANIRRLVQIGRENLATERSEAEMIASTTNGAALLQVLQLEADYFDLGDRLAGRLGELNSLLGTGEGARQALRELADFETRLQSIASEQIRAAATIG